MLGAIHSSRVYQLHVRLAFLFLGPPGRHHDPRKFGLEQHCKSYKVSNRRNSVLEHIRWLAGVYVGHWPTVLC